MEEAEKVDPESIPKNGDVQNAQGKSCALCGCSTPAVRCDRCSSQLFCLSCDDMYHRHPKRRLHLRKAVDSIWASARSPRLRRHAELPGDPSKIPIPPPRTKKRERHTIGGRIFMKSGLELGSFGHSKVFDARSLPSPKDYFADRKSPGIADTNQDKTQQIIKGEPNQIYENDNMENLNGNLDNSVLDDRSPWNATRPNISSPIQVSIPSSSPDMTASGQVFGYHTKPHSQSVADLPGHSSNPVGHQGYHFHPPYVHPYMHPTVHPPYSHSMAHLNCAQCLSSSWSNLVNPHPSPYFHPMPWGSAQSTMTHGHPMHATGQMKHSHGELSYPESGFLYPYQGGFSEAPPAVDPNFVKGLHKQTEAQKTEKEVANSKDNQTAEEIGTTSPVPMDTNSNECDSSIAAASTYRRMQTVEEEPPKPENPSQPWACLHCTFINPAGIYICQVCCKTSYGNKSQREEDDRNTESPLINHDAPEHCNELSQSKDAIKVI